MRDVFPSTISTVGDRRAGHARPDSSLPQKSRLLAPSGAHDLHKQALTNPLLSKHVWGDKDNRRLAFTDLGLEAIQSTRKLRDVLIRNSVNLGDRFVGMTQRDWKPE